MASYTVDERTENIIKKIARQYPDIYDDCCQVGYISAMRVSEMFAGEPEEKFYRKMYNRVRIDVARYAASNRGPISLNLNRIYDSRNSTDEVKRQYESAKTPLRLDWAMEHGDSWYDVIGFEDPAFEAMGERHDASNLVAEINTELDSLSPVLKAVVQMRLSNVSLREIGKAIGVSRQRANQLLDEATCILRKRLA